ncbi:MAG: TIGR03668 family PPOX class F420-dependent oxidoreductase [bacterium]|nr:TIGR03668 family PPOX class F420-dependent oxidoreductase [bacterium]
MATLEEVQGILATHRIGQLATADAEAAPHMVPICFASDELAIYTAIDHKPKRQTGYRMKRIRNIVANSRVAFLVHHYEEDWTKLYYVMVRGTAHILEDGAEYWRALALLEAKYRQYREAKLSEVAGLVIKITPTSVSHWGWLDSLK